MKHAPEVDGQGGARNRGTRRMPAGRARLRGGAAEIAGAHAGGNGNGTSELRRVEGMLADLAIGLQRISAAADIAGLARTARLALRQLVQADGTILMLSDGRARESGRKAKRTRWRAFGADAYESIVGQWVVSHDSPVVSSDVSADPRFLGLFRRGAPLMSVAVFPVRYGAAIGAVGCRWKASRIATSEEMLLVSLIADAMARALERLGSREDTHHRRSAEKAARNAEVRYEDLVEMLPIAVYACDRKGRITQFNPKAAALWGREPRLGESLEKFCRVFKLYRPDGALLKPGNCPMLDTLDTGKARRNVELVIERPDGTRFSAVANTSVIYDGDRRPIGAVNCLLDITTRRRLAEAVRAVAQGVASHSSAAYFNSLLDQLAGVLSPDHIYIGELLPGQRRIRVIAARSDDRFVAGSEYDLEGTPSGSIVGGRQLCVEEGIAKKFPNDQLLSEWGVEGYVGTPLFDSKQRPLGLISLLSCEPLKSAEFTASLLQIVAVRVAGEIERVRSERLLQQLSGRLLRAQDNERRKLGRDLHDTTAQGLAALEINLANLRKMSPELPKAARRLLRDASDLASQCAREIRSMAYTLRPPLLDEIGLPPALRVLADGFARHSGIKCRLVGPARFPRLPADHELALYRIAQEALANVHRHSGSKTAVIRLSADRQRVGMAIEDAGRGFPKAVVEAAEAGRPQAGIGLGGMAERVRQFGGTFSLQSNRRGARIRVELPCAPARQ